MAKVIDVRVLELSGQAHREISGAIMSGILAAQSAATSAASTALGKVGPGGAAKGGGGLGAQILSAISSPAGLLAASFGKLAIAAGVAALAFKSVSLASPGTMERLNLAFEDTLAVVGQALVPAFEFMTSIIRTVGDVLASILPPASSLREIFQPIAEMFRSLMEALAPIAKFIQTVLTMALKALAIALQVLMLPIQFLVGIIKGLIGEEEKLASSVAAAVRNITFTTSDAFQKAAYTAAYKNSAGTGDGEYQSPLAGISDTLRGIGEDVGTLVRHFVGAGSVLGNLAGFGLYNKMSDKVNTELDRVKKAKTGGSGGSNLQEAMGFKVEGGQGKAQGGNIRESLGLGNGGGIAEALGLNLGNKTKAPESANSIREMLGLGAGGKGKESEKGKDDEEPTRIDYAPRTEAEAQREQIDQAKRRFHDGHPGGR